MMIDAGLAEPFPDADARKAVLVANLSDGAVAGVPVADLDTQEAT